MEIICPVCKNREKSIIISGINRGKRNGTCTICSNKIAHEWYLKNREYQINKIKNIQKITNYATEKTPRQRSLRNIKRASRYDYSLSGKKCCLCGKLATERHHTTKPITRENIRFLCHTCHRKVHEDKNLNKKIGIRRDFLIYG